MLVKIFDLETSSLNADWGIILCGSIKTYGKKGITTYRADEYPTWNKKRSDDKAIVADIIADLETADIIVAHNGQWFDKPFLNAKCVKHGLPPSLRRKKFVDPVQIARRHMKLGRNSLQAVAYFLEVSQSKTPLEQTHWLKATLDGNRESMTKIVKHCDQDVLTLEDVYQMVKPLVEKIDSSGSSY